MPCNNAPLRLKRHSLEAYMGYTIMGYTIDKTILVKDDSGNIISRCETIEEANKILTALITAEAIRKGLMTDKNELAETPQTQPSERAPKVEVVKTEEVTQPEPHGIAKFVEAHTPVDTRVVDRITGEDLGSTD